MKIFISILCFAILLIPFNADIASSEINNLNTLLIKNSINDKIKKEFKNGTSSSRTECRENIDNIQNALNFLSTFQEIRTEKVDFNHLVALGVLTEVPECPDGGKYTVKHNNKITNIKCSKHDFSVINDSVDDLKSIYSPTAEDMVYICQDPIMQENEEYNIGNTSSDPAIKKPPVNTDKIKIEEKPPIEKIKPEEPVEQKPIKKVNTAYSRPFADTDPKKAYANCLNWAKKAKEANIHTLVISFEGLASYSKTYTKKVYSYQDSLRKGLAAKKPGVTGMNFVAKYLVVPSMKKYFHKVDFLLLPETSESKKSSTGLMAAKAWHAVHGKSLNLIIMGHSFGGYTVLKLTKKLHAVGIPVKNALTIDARAMPQNYKYFSSTTNIMNHYNYYQKGLFMPGYSIKGANNEKVRGSSHGTMPKNKKVISRYLMMLKNN